MNTNIHKCFKQKQVFYYESQNAVICNTDAAEFLNNIKDESVDCVFFDPPYFLSNNGISCQGGKQVSVNKGKWDAGASFEHKVNFYKTYLLELKRVMTNSATIWISGTYHNIYIIGFLLEELGFKILNNVTWQKTNPPPNLACRCLTHSTETVVWAKKDNKNAKHVFNYELMKKYNDEKQLKDVWTGSLTPKSEKSFGKHPTQKPLYLLSRIIETSTQEGDVVLDCMAGSFTTGVAAVSLERFFIGNDFERDYCEIGRQRIENEEGK